MTSYELYLDYVNNFLTVSVFAQWHGLTEKEALAIIDNERELSSSSRHEYFAT